MPQAPSKKFTIPKWLLPAVAIGLVLFVVGVKLADKSPSQAECVKRWNASGPSNYEALSLMLSQGETVATVGFAKDFPDKCLVTVGVNAGADSYADYYREAGEKGSYRRYDTAALNLVDDVDKKWNARVESNGEIELGYP